MKNKTSMENLTEEHRECLPSEQELAAFQRAIQVITGKWKVEILWFLLHGTRRFGQIRKAFPSITQHMLTAQLRALEQDGLIIRTSYAEIPPRVEYALTERAYALKPVFQALAAWAQQASEPE
ncbi:helix-turn-helix domain-containing protein [Acetobacter sp. DsW_54]|uniref:winged helix-turn-helix transcriptional regulator n=2 Tax=Acetobacter TaxID=434 RepID=UPI000A3BAE55|nr:helix-turn-helix domain-containing protein [Acetobacter sp. DsW_54]